MKISTFTTVTNPQQRGDNWEDAYRCYEALSDEVVVVDGSYKEVNKYYEIQRFMMVTYFWPIEFKWDFIGQQFQRGYEAATGDWVIHADLDFIFHEEDIDRIRSVLYDFPGAPAVSFYKHQFIQPDRYNLKSRLVLAVNKREYGNRIKFNGGGDLCQPTLDGLDIDIDSIPASGIPFYNYEKPTKTEAQIKDDVGRMDRAYERFFGRYLYGKGTDESAYEGWLKMVLGRYNKPQKEVSLESHPLFVQKTLKNLRPDQFGYNAFGRLKENNYVENLVSSR